MADSLQTYLSERDRALEALKSSEAELRALLAAMRDVIIVLDAQGRYLKIAPTHPDELKYSFDTILDKLRRWGKSQARSGKW